jgi:hypothetical protein
LELSEEQYKERFKKRIEDIKKAMAEGKKWFAAEADLLLLLKNKEK